MPFENVGLTAEQSKRLKPNSDTEGFKPLVLEALTGPARPGGSAADPEVPFKVNEKTQPHTPGIHDDGLNGKSDDGGKVTYDRAGNITSWQSKDTKTTRAYFYHDSNVDRAKLLGIKDQSIYQDKNGTYFQFAEVNGKKTPVPKFFTKAFGATAFADLRGATKDEAMFDRAVGKKIAPVVMPISLTKHLNISATLDMVTDNHGHVWKRDQPGKPLTEYLQTPAGKLAKTKFQATDAQLLPVDSYVSADKEKLYKNASKPLDSIKAYSVEQTELGDCYFEGSLAEESLKHPERIAQMIKDNYDGTYTVSFPLSDPTFKGQIPFIKRPTLDVTVEAPTPPELATFNEPYYRNQDNGYWSSVMEKAHRYMTGKITHDDGGAGSDGLQLLSGVRKVVNFWHPGDSGTVADFPDTSFETQTFTADPRDTKDPTPALGWSETMKKALDRGEPVVARTNGGGNQWVIVTGGTSDPKVLGRSSEVGRENNQFHILDGHIYSVVKVEHKDDGHGDLITIRNPLANVIANSGKDFIRPFDRPTNGYFQVRQNDFEKLFSGFYIN